MYTRDRIFCLLALMLFFLQGKASSAGDRSVLPAESFSGIDFRNGLLKASVEGQKFQKVMEEVAQKTGIAIVISDPTDEDLTIHFDYLPLEKSLQQLLKAKSYVFIYRLDEAYQSSKLMRVLVFPKSEGWTREGPKRKAGKKLVTQTKGSMKETHNPDQKMLGELLQNLPQNKLGLDIEFYEALEGMPDTEGFREMIQELEEALQGLPEEGMDLKQEIYHALKGRP